MIFDRPTTIRETLRMLSSMVRHKLRRAPAAAVAAVLVVPRAKPSAEDLVWRELQSLTPGGGGPLLWITKCGRFVITERPSRVPGESSFYALHDRTAEVTIGAWDSAEHAKFVAQHRARRK